MQKIERATIADIPFIAKVIIEAEKSGTENLGLATLFSLTHEEVYTYLCRILAEEIDGCEFSLSSFLIAKDDEYPMAALGAWIEGAYDDMDSSTLKSNLIGYTFPKESLVRMRENQEVIKELLFKREKGSLQFEYSYVDPKYRGQGLITKLDIAHIENVKQISPDTRNAYLQVFSNNPTIIKTHTKAGFSIAEEKKSTHSRILDFLPGDTKLLMKATL